jgi:hypothetical protein
VVIAVAVPTGTGTVRVGNPRREIMKIMLGTAIAVFSLGIGSSYAGDGDGHSATTLFTSIQNERPVAAQKGTAQDSGAVVQAYDTRSQGQGTWLFRVFSLP